jgi:hypothetical protein
LERTARRRAASRAAARPNTSKNLILFKQVQYEV